MTCRVSSGPKSGAAATQWGMCRCLPQPLPAPLLATAAADPALQLLSTCSGLCSPAVGSKRLSSDLEESMGGGGGVVSSSPLVRRGHRVGFRGR